MSQFWTALQGAVPPRRGDSTRQRVVPQLPGVLSPAGDSRDPQAPGGVCLQSPSSLCFPGQEPIKVIGVVLGIGLALLILASFGYTFIRWYRRGHSRRREYGQGRGQEGQGGRQGREGSEHGAAGTGVWGARGMGSPGAGGLWADLGAL